MFQTEHLQEKWQPVLEHPELPKIEDSYRRAVTTVILENQEKALNEDRSFLTETVPTGYAGGNASLDTWDPILISLVRRAMPNLIAYDICGVQPMTGPTGLIFAMRARFASMDGAEALADEAMPDISNQNAAGTIGGGDIGATETNPAVLNDSPSAGTYTSATGQTTVQGEALGDSATNAFAEMAFSIEKHTVTAVTRAMKAEYTMELAQDLKAVHGLNAESELANILSVEILAEINREVLDKINTDAVKISDGTGAVVGAGFAGWDISAAATSGIGNNDGRWAVERYKNLGVKIELEANAIAVATRRGKGSFIICSSNVASVLAASGVLDYAPALSTNLKVDDTGSLFAGVLNGSIKVFVDPYAAADYITVGYKGTNPYDAGLFYCPYVPLTMVKTIGADDFQPRIGFKTRYGMVNNPYVGSLAGENTYFRTMNVLGIT